MAAQKKRLFFALWPDGATREAICNRTAQVLRAAGGRATARPNLHLTLAFLHNVDEDLLPCVSAAAKRAATRPFSFSLCRIGMWPRSSILWLAPASGDDEAGGAGRLAARLWDELKVCGFTPERRRFRAHVTLARKVHRRFDTRAIEPIAWRVREFALMESTNTGNHPRYQALLRFELAGTKKSAGAASSRA